MATRRLNATIAEQAERFRALSDTLQTAMSDARLLRRTLEILAEAQQALSAELKRPRRLRPALTLRHANRVF